jgi:GntR family transcriptional regulator
MRAKHQEIAHQLREAIDRGELPPGTRLPSETDLMNTYQVARGTVRQAISLLTNEGLVTPMSGIGTVVRETAQIRLSYTPPTPSPIWATSAGDDAHDDVVLAEWEPADPETAERLAIEPGARVLRRVRHQAKGRDVVQIHEQWVPELFIAAIRSTSGDDLTDKTRVQSGDLFQLLRATDHAPAETSEIITSRMPNPEERETLSLPPGTPVLVTHRTTQTDDGTPVETSIFVGAADRMSLAYTVSLTDR